MSTFVNFFSIHSLRTSSTNNLETGISIGPIETNLPNLLPLSVLNPLTLVIVPFELTSMFIDYQCINLQKYNISRMEEKQEVLRKMEAKKVTQEVKSHGEAAKVITKTLENNEDIEISDDFTLVYADEYCFIYKLNH